MAMVGINSKIALHNKQHESIQPNEIYICGQFPNLVGVDYSFTTNGMREGHYVLDSGMRSQHLKATFSWPDQPLFAPPVAIQQSIV
jgi:hypothetical protein